ncbi:hypothetical protein E4U55_004535 [Claviceps digitariae]|nr:hypothetical protein E4U55_004535 [Claviceps digitariae]
MPRKVDATMELRGEVEDRHGHGHGHGNGNGNGIPMDESQRSGTVERTISEGRESGDQKEQREHKDAVTIEDLMLPKSIITRLAKGVLPPNTQIQANVILAMSKSATVFINYLASRANEHTINANKKTISPADVFKALDDIEFDFLKQPLEAEFAKFNQIQTEKRTNYRQKYKTTKSKSQNQDSDTTMADTTASPDREAGPRSKKARVDDNGADEDEADVDAETDEERDAQDDADDDDDDEEEEDQEQDEEEEGQDEDMEDDTEAHADATQDVLEERILDDGDEALGGDESD